MEQPHLNLEVKTLGHLPLLEVEGDLDQWTSHSLVEAMNQVIDSECEGVILDLTRIRSMDAGSIKHLFDACKALGPDRKLCAVARGRSEQLIRMTRLDSMVQVCAELNLAKEFLTEKIEKP